jgi:hypothetical protein
MLACFCAAHGLAQQPDPAAANRELIGEGPKTEVQQSANATLDVGGANAASPNLTGANLRGNLGASRPLPAASPSPTPTTGVPNYSFATPNLTPDLNASGRVGPLSAEDRRDLAGLVLPRFQSRRAAASQNVLSPNQPDNWRYRYFNGRWWYWQPSKTWAFWDGRAWRPAAAGSSS